MRLKHLVRTVLLGYLMCGVTFAVCMNLVLYGKNMPSVFAVASPSMDGERTMLLWATVVVPILFWPFIVLALVINWARR